MKQYIMTSIRTQLSSAKRVANHFRYQLYEVRPTHSSFQFLKYPQILSSFCTNTNLKTYNETKINNEQTNLTSTEQQYKKQLSQFLIRDKISNNYHKRDRELVFLTKYKSSNVKFKTVETYDRGGRKFSKLSARFRMGNKYGCKTFHATYWKPGGGHKISKNSINALVFISHGYGEYLGDAYDEVAKFWCDELGGGSLVFGHDHAGHGRTTAGERVLVNNIKELVAPIIEHSKEVQKWENCGSGNLPLFLVGHSMGGLISMLAVIKKERLFRGFIGVSPLVMISPERATPTNKFLAKQLQKYFPRFTLPSFMDNNDDNHITRNKGFVENIKKDKLRYHGGPKARMGYILIKSCEKLQNNMAKISIPLLILQGKKDKLVEPSGANLIHENVSSNDKEYILYEDAYHNLFVELDDVKKDVQMKTLKWMNERL